MKIIPLQKINHYKLDWYIVVNIFTCICKKKLKRQKVKYHNKIYTTATTNDPLHNTNMIIDEIYHNCRAVNIKKEI